MQNTIQQEVRQRTHFGPQKPQCDFENAQLIELALLLLGATFENVRLPKIEIKAIPVPVRE